MAVICLLGYNPRASRARSKETGVAVRNVNERDGMNVKFSYEYDAVRSQNNYYWAIYEKRHLGLLSGWMNGVFWCVIPPQVTGQGPSAAAVSSDGKLIGRSLHALSLWRTVRSTDRLNDWPNLWLNRSIDWLIKWTTEWPTDWQTEQIGRLND